jgi:hypothetical protein
VDLGRRRCKPQARSSSRWLAPLARLSQANMAFRPRAAEHDGSFTVSLRLFFTLGRKMH